MLEQVAINGKVKKEQVQLHSMKGTFFLPVNENNLGACNCTQLGWGDNLTSTAL